MKRLGWTRKEKERAVLKNGAKLLEERIKTCFGRDNPIKIFSATQIELALQIYKQRFPIQTFEIKRFYAWRKGIIDGRMLFVYIYEGDVGDYNKYGQEIFRNIAVSSMMSGHPNVLKLFGCCLEFPVPALVYEDAENGNLNSRGGLDGDGSPLSSWANRLKIAKEIASAVAYMHTAFPTPIIHRNIQTGTIFVNQDYATKLTDFSFSIAIPQGETHIEDVVTGCYGYLDPAYASSGLITEKTDVYSFGILLLIFLTGKSAIDFEARGRESLAVYVEGLVKEGKFNEIADPEILGNVNGIEQELHPQLKAFLELALSCVRLSPEDRPSMIEVAKQL